LVMRLQTGETCCVFIDHLLFLRFYKLSRQVIQEEKALLESHPFGYVSPEHPEKRKSPQLENRCDCLELLYHLEQ
jgi:hypothetical protein